jgi:hypothetical protein
MPTRPPRTRRLRLCAFSLLFALSSLALGARARRQEVYPYRFELVWSSAVRMVRVDFGFEITEQDKDNGYLLFRYADGGRTHPGSFEIVPAQLEGREGVQVVAQIPAMPAYVEQMMLTRLGRKLSQDHGEPPRPKRPEPPKEPAPPEADEGTAAFGLDGTTSRPEGD